MARIGPHPQSGHRPAWRRLLPLVAAASLGAAYFARRPKRWDLRDKRVVITGGSRGLGLLMALEAVRRGAHVALIARDEAELARARTQVAEAGPGRVIAIPCDLSEAGAPEALIARVERELGPIDVLINNAGIISVGPADLMRPADFEAAMAINFWAALHTCLAVLPRMRHRRGGRIVNISSIGGRLAFPHLMPYTASKFALTGFSEALTAEAAKDGIKVTTVNPGLMRTGSVLHAKFKGRAKKEYAWFTLASSMPGLTMAAEEAARRIIDATVRGDRVCILTGPAQWAARLHGLAPGFTIGVLTAVNRVLPGSRGGAVESQNGYWLENPVSRLPLTALTREAAGRNNEIPPL